MLQSVLSDDDEDQNYYSKNDDGLSIYDHFVDDKLSEKVYKYSHRHFKRDSFYEYSQTVPVRARLKIF